ncbi:hypothetical protein K0M31_006555 [Melipona bicolor]|uniref:Uncharacterized protein n=1 Tax=Melipona bicolor TaxID=60889 RepID=A0AA40FCD3_9HYME|nr:hypothetical protein K0M31_006555 [Melipona bicolor]
MKPQIPQIIQKRNEQSIISRNGFKDADFVQLNSGNSGIQTFPDTMMCFDKPILVESVDIQILQVISALFFVQTGKLMGSQEPDPAIKRINFVRAPPYT